METVSCSVKSEEKASRIELLIRLVYWIPLYIVLVVLSLIAGILLFVNLFTVLILGKRVLVEFIEKYWQYQAKFEAYYLLLTDERPPIMPE
ncbi:MAG: DUF4389 domain-containing protein [Candidatus Diapherotrites archaeon]